MTIKTAVLFCDRRWPVKRPLIDTVVNTLSERKRDTVVGFRRNRYIFTSIISFKRGGGTDSTYSISQPLATVTPSSTTRHRPPPLATVTPSLALRFKKSVKIETNVRNVLQIPLPQCPKGVTPHPLHERDKLPPSSRV